MTKPSLPGDVRSGLEVRLYCSSLCLLHNTGIDQVLALKQVASGAHYDSETAAYLAQQGTPQHSAQESTPSAIAHASTPFQDASASYTVEASMVPPDIQLSQAVQMSMPHELDTSYYGWPVAYAQSLQLPVVSACLVITFHAHSGMSLLVM